MNLNGAVQEAVVFADWVEESLGAVESHASSLVPPADVGHILMTGSGSDYMPADAAAVQLDRYTVQLRPLTRWITVTVATAARHRRRTCHDVRRPSRQAHITAAAHQRRTAGHHPRLSATRVHGLHGGCAHRIHRPRRYCYACLFITVQYSYWTISLRLQLQSDVLLKCQLYCNIQHTNFCINFF